MTSLVQKLARLADLFGGNQNGYGVPYSNRNLLVDGNKDAWSGTTAALGTTGAYTVNLLQAGTAGAGGAGTYSQGTFGTGSATVNGLSRPVKYYGIHTQTTGSTGTLAALNGPLLYRLVEDVSTMEGSSVTYSVWLWVSTGTLNVTQVFTQQNFGTGGSPSAALNTLVPVNWTLTTTPQRFSVLINVPGIAGKTVGTSSPGSTLFGICPPVGATYVIADAQWQVEYCSPNASTSIAGNGGAPTTFEYRGQQAELARSQRYYESGNVVLSATSTATFPQRGFAVSKRIAPTMTLTPNSGTGGVIAAIGVDGFWQNTAHSVQVAATWIADSRL